MAFHIAVTFEDVDRLEPVADVAKTLLGHVA